ncbi:hypothetical protein BE18_47535 [Sorangium cellulosum]|uniref:Uncharacterized protein n=1 Tax=Sorangium cellulosum TaxID=56 RepID=A0A150RES0_SORCE|nr:hypothetical protein BE18_47535 [Sorangium cellulosum]
MPKKPASKRSTRSSIAAWRTYVFPFASGSGSNTAPTSQRLAGIGATASRSSSSRRKSASTSSTPPGRRRPTPTIAMGSSLASARAARGRASVLGAAPPRGSASRRKPASRCGDGRSNVMVAGSLTPVAFWRRRRSSTAMSESSPRSKKPRCGSRRDRSAWPSTAAVCARTRETRWRRRASPESARRVATSAVSSCSVDALGCASSARRASGRSAMSGRWRAEAYDGAKRAQSIDAMVTWVSSRSSALASAATAISGSIAAKPPRRRPCATSKVSIPAPAHAPHATDVARSPSARRSSASASRKAFAAA